MDSFLNSLLTVDIILAWMLWYAAVGSVRTMGSVRTVGSVRTLGSVRTIRAVGCHRIGPLFDNMILGRSDHTSGSLWSGRWTISTGVAFCLST